MRLIATLCLCLSLAACSSRHNIAGTDYGWDAKGTSVLADVNVNGLQIRHVRKIDSDCSDGFRDHLELNGEIGADSAVLIKQLLGDARNCVSLGGVNYATLVYMNAHGGSIEDGYKIGKLFRKQGVRAVVTGDQLCASACAVAFIGAKYRSVRHHGKLVFDALYSAENIGPGCSNTLAKTSMKRYLVKMMRREDGLKLYGLSMGYCGSTNVWTINADIARIYDLTTG